VICGNDRPHSGYRHLADKDEVPAFASSPGFALQVRRPRREPRALSSDCSERCRVVEVAAFGLPLPPPPLGAVASGPLGGAFDLGGGHLREAPTSSASISVTERLSPSGVSQLRCRSRPVTITRSPLERESARCSAWSRQTLTRRNEVSPSPPDGRQTRPECGSGRRVRASPIRGRAAVGGCQTVPSPYRTRSSRSRSGRSPAWAGR